MKKAIAIIVSVLFVFAVASISFAAEEKKAAPAPAEKKAAPAKMEEKKAPMKEEKGMEKKAAAKTKQVTGDVAAVDAKAGTITVKSKKAETTVTCDDKTKVMMGKEKKACADVKVGDKVTVKSAEADGKNAAKSVKIHEAKPAEKKMEKKAEKKMEKKAEPAKPAEKK